jgi:hypothetical protein
MRDEYESLKDVLRGMGGSPTADEVSKAMASFGLLMLHLQLLSAPRFRAEFSSCSFGASPLRDQTEN